MERLEELNTELQRTVEDLRAENESLKQKVEALQLELMTKSLDNAQLQQQQQQQQQQKQQQQQQEPQRPIELFPTKPSKYSDPRFLSTDEIREIKFKMISRKVRTFDYNEGKPETFNCFTRIETEDEMPMDPPKNDGLTATPMGTFLTPVAGKYRFDLKFDVTGKGKLAWYLCCVPKEDDIFDKKHDGYDDRDDDNDDDDTMTEDEKKEKDRIYYDEKLCRQLLFTIDTKDEYWVVEETGCVGVDCDKGVRVWTEMVVLERPFSADSAMCTFSGRLVC